MCTVDCASSDRLAWPWELSELKLAKNQLHKTIFTWGRPMTYGYDLYIFGYLSGFMRDCCSEILIFFPSFEILTIGVGENPVRADLSSGQPVPRGRSRIQIFSYLFQSSRLIGRSAAMALKIAPIERARIFTSKYHQWNYNCG